jgi:hypothetical protein
VEDLCNENYKSLKKKIEDYRIWKDRPMFMDWQNRYCENATKILIAIAIKIPMISITEIEKSTLNFIWKHKDQE